MTQALGSFVPKPQVTGDRFQPSVGKGRPLIVQVIGLDGAKAVGGENGQAGSVKKALFVNVWDLLGGPVAKDEHDNLVMGPQNTVYCNVQWMAGAVVDNLEPYVGGPPMAVKISSQRNKQNTYNYLTIAPCEGPELQQVNVVFASDPTRFDREVQARAVAAAQQAAQPAYNQSGFQPMAQPSAPAQVAQPQYQQAPPAQQWQQPAAPAGAIANIPAQVAQQWQGVDQAMQNAQFSPAQAPPVQQYAPAPQQPVAQPQYQQAPPVQQYAPAPPQMQQPAPLAAPPFQAAPGPLPVNDSQVSAILAGLTQQAQA